MSTTKIRVTTEKYPEAKASWELDIGASTAHLCPEDQLKFTLLYNNLTYDLVAAVVAKLGWEYSKLISGEVDRAQFDLNMTETLSVLASHS